jgi:hypothetical protein
MKKAIGFAVVLLFMAGAVHAKAYETSMTAGGYEVAVSIDHNPPVIGDNTVTIEIRNASGKSVRDARVALYTVMPSMPAMNATTAATPQGNTYTAVIKPSMGGEWAVTVSFTGSDGKVRKGTFKFVI